MPASSVVRNCTIAVFSFFLVFTGWRAPHQKRLHDRQGARWFDWLVVSCTLLFSAWLLRHLVGMSGAYIATVSAFAAVTLTFLPKPVSFIAPMLLGTPVIIWVATRLNVPRWSRRSAYARNGRRPPVVPGPSV